MNVHFNYSPNPRALVCEFPCIKMWVINKPDRKSGLWRKTLSEVVYLNINDHSHGSRTLSFWNPWLD